MKRLVKEVAGEELESLIKIEKGIPIYPHRNNRYPLGEMDIGDSFYINKVSRSGVYVCAKRKNMKITIRNDGEGYRVWRIA